VGGGGVGGLNEAVSRVDCISVALRCVCVVYVNDVCLLGVGWVWEGQCLNGGAGCNFCRSLGVMPPAQHIRQHTTSH